MPKAGPEYACAVEIAVYSAVSILRYLILFRGYSRSSFEVVRNLAQIFMFWTDIFWEGFPKFLTQFHKLSRITIESVSKFDDDRPKQQQRRFVVVVATRN